MSANSKAKDRRRADIAFARAALGMAMAGADGRWLQVNSAFCQMLGYGEAELLDAPLSALTHPEDQDIDDSFRQQLMRGRIPSYQIEKRFFHKKGFLIWVLLSVSWVEPEATAGLPGFFVFQIQDVTGRKALENTLKMNEERLQRVLENLPDAVCRYQKDLVLTYVNSAIEAISGLAPDQLIGKSAAEWGLGGGDGAIWEAKLRAVFKTGYPERADLTFNTPLGSRHLHARFIPDRDEQGTVAMVLVVCQDMTQQVVMETELRVSNNQLQEALAEVKQLQGILPICSYCKKIRDDQDYWESLESYICRHSKAQFTHGLCPDCFKQAVTQVTAEYAAANQKGKPRAARKGGNT